MVIIFEETLGGVGVVRVAKIEFDDLPSDLRPLVARLLEVDSTQDSALRDAGSIKISAGERAIKLRSWDIPPEATPLIAFLRARARPA